MKNRRGNLQDQKQRVLLDDKQKVMLCCSMVVVVVVVVEGDVQAQSWAIGAGGWSLISMEEQEM
jgi:hypothetical protein